MTGSELQRRIRVYIKAAHKRYKGRNRWTNFATSAFTLVMIVVAFAPDGRADYQLLAGAAALSWGFYFLLSPLRARALRRYHEHERAHFLQMVPEDSPAYPQALAHLMHAPYHRALARRLLEELPGGPVLLADDEDSEIIFDDAPAEKAVPVAPAKPIPTIEEPAKPAPVPPAKPAAPEPVPEFMPLDPMDGGDTTKKAGA